MTIYSQMQEKIKKARESCNTKIRKLQKLDETFIQVGVDAEAHVTRLTQWINEHKILSTADYSLVNSLNKKATKMSNTTTEAIKTALEEVGKAIKECEDETERDEQKLYLAAKKYLQGTNWVYIRSWKQS